MISSETMMQLDSVVVEFVRAPNRKMVRIHINRTGVEFHVDQACSNFSIFNSDVRLIAAIARQMQEPVTWKDED